MGAESLDVTASFFELDFLKKLVASSEMHASLVWKSLEMAYTCKDGADDERPPFIGVARSSQISNRGTKLLHSEQVLDVLRRSWSHVALMGGPKAHDGVPYSWVGLAYPGNFEPPEVGIEGGGDSRSRDVHEESVAPDLVEVLCGEDELGVGSWAVERQARRDSLGRLGGDRVAITLAPS